MMAMDSPWIQTSQLCLTAKGRHAVLGHLHLAQTGDSQGLTSNCHGIAVSGPRDMKTGHEDTSFSTKDFLVGGIPTPLKNMSSSVGIMKFPIYGKIKKCYSQ